MIRHLILIILLLCFHVSLSFAQKNIFTIKHVDSVRVVKNKKTGDYDRICIGNVFLEEQEKKIKFFCDSTYEHADTQIIEAFGNILLDKADTVQMTGEYMSLNLKTNLLKARLNVVLKDPKAQLYTSYLDYDLNTDVGVYYNGGELVDSTSTLRSLYGEYSTATGASFFRDNVIIKGKDYTINTDSLKYNVKNGEARIIAPTNLNHYNYKMYTENGIYNTQTGIANFTQNTKLVNKNYTLTGDILNYAQKSGIGVLTNNCKMVDTVNNFTLTGDYMKSFNQSDSIIATKNIEALYFLGKDTLFIHADTVLLDKDTLENNIISAFRKVKIFKESMQGKCDSLSFHLANSLMKMFYNATMWSGLNQFTGDTIKAEFEEQKLKYINLIDNGMVTSVEDSTKKYYNQMKGRNIKGFVTKDTLRRIEVYGNGESIYFLKEKDKLGGLNYVKCSDITIRLNKGDIETVVFKKDPQGTVYPVEDIGTGKSRLYLSGFRWNEANRPLKREDIFKWNEVKEKDLIKVEREVLTEDDDKKKDEKENDKRRKGRERR